MERSSKVHHRREEVTFVSSNTIPKPKPVSQRPPAIKGGNRLLEECAPLPTLTLWASLVSESFFFPEAEVSRESARPITGLKRLLHTSCRQFDPINQVHYSPHPVRMCYITEPSEGPTHARPIKVAGMSIRRAVRWRGEAARLPHPHLINVCRSVT